ncbi:AAA family ATPase [Vibrio aestuarianus subsp. francensis]|uniref:AAA family ATPase n=1 Tax=Vibrio aestuarianus TaxID=28171 RepID=UPI001456160F|nr:AAA family ATPase [Vibrio aestuarianus]NLS80596.1 AAA family ATPase [Vibrio aestuarianus subsp. francensis]CAH8184607.1 Anticodon nuclease [Vibrio aestuarianus]
MSELVYSDLGKVSEKFRDVFENGVPRGKKTQTVNQILVFAYNGTGKTRLSMAFKDLGKDVISRPANVMDDVTTPLEVEETTRDTLYFNAFTEDLFSWDNDLDNDKQRVLKINQDSHFFDGLQELEMENRIRPLLQRYADFDFQIDYKEWTVNFKREIQNDDDSHEIVEHIKVSRGEENIFVWCFFLAVAQLAIDGQEAYSWVNYLYIDDPISSLDDHNAISVASHLAQLLKSANGSIKTVISSHHALFFNVMWNELNEKGKLQPYFLKHDKDNKKYSLKYTKDTPFFHHLALLEQLHQASESGSLFTYHFTVLRSILEKTATFHGFNNFSACIKKQANDPEGILHARLVNILSHGNYSLFEPMEMTEENKGHFRNILSDFMENYRFNPDLFPDLVEQKTVTEQ